MLRLINAGTFAIRRHPLLVRTVIFFGAVLLVAGHGAFFYFMRAHMGLSAWAVCGAILLLIVKHLGLFGPVFARFRRRSGTKTDSDAQRETNRR
jgi:hypothetical protein